MITANEHEIATRIQDKYKKCLSERKSFAMKKRASNLFAVFLISSCKRDGFLWDICAVKSLEING